MTADCISREKREGTLGLLFLTPLSAFDVILGKGATHTLRVLALFLATVPVLGLPFLLGGVGWTQAVWAIVNEAGAVLLAIAAGIYASTKGGTTIQVMMTAEGYALSLAIASNFLHVTTGWISFRHRWVIPVYLLWTSATDLILFALVIRQSVRRLSQTWREESTSDAQPAWVKLFSTSAFWQELFRWDKGRTLDRNPVAWLQEYSWTARLTKWGWFIVLLGAELIMAIIWLTPKRISWQPALTAILAAGVAFSAAGSFRRERQDGLLELLLITPVSVRQLIRGRMWGIGCHFLPAIGLLIVGWTGEHMLNPKVPGLGPPDPLILNPATFCLIIVFGLYLSLGHLHFLLGWVLTWVVAFILPMLIGVSIIQFGFCTPRMTLVLITTIQLLLSIALWFLLEQSLRDRTFLQADTV